MFDLIEMLEDASVGYVLVGGWPWLCTATGA